MKVLHVIRSNNDTLAQQVREEIERSGGARQTILLIQDGVYVRPKDAPAFVCSDDAVARGVETELLLVGYDRIVEMIFEHDKVITW